MISDGGGERVAPEPKLIDGIGTPPFNRRGLSLRHGRKIEARRKTLALLLFLSQ